MLTARLEDEANSALATLARAGVPARKVNSGRGSFDVTVSPRELDRAVEVLAAAGLPRQEEPGLADLFPEPGLVSSATEQRIRYHRAIAGELGSSLRRLPGVREARVHLGLPAEQPRRLDRTPAQPVKASVMLVMEGPDGERSDAARAARSLVAGAVVGLEPDAVSVVVSTARALPPMAAPTDTGFQPPMLAAGLGTILSGLILSGLILFRRRRTSFASPPRDPTTRELQNEEGKGH